MRAFRRRSPALALSLSIFVVALIGLPRAACEEKTPGQLAQDVETGFCSQPEVSIFGMPKPCAGPTCVCAQATERAPGSGAGEQECRLEGSCLMCVDLQQLLTDVVGSAGHRYGLHDSLGHSMDCLRVVFSPLSGVTRYFGVFHTYDTDLKTFNVHLAQSVNLLDWEFLRTLLENADMPDIHIDSVTGKVLLLHEQWMNPQSQSPCRLGFALYANVASLVAGAMLSSFIAPSSLSSLEGTPCAYAWDAVGGRVQVGFHFNNNQQRDQVAKGALSGFLGSPGDTPDWSASNDAPYNAAFTAAGATGNIGDRTHLLFNQVDYNVQEGNVQPPPIVPTNFGDWRVWLYSFADQSILLLPVRTHGGSQSFGNPFAAIVPGPDGKPSLCVTYFVFSEQSSPGEAGSLLFYTPL